MGKAERQNISGVLLLNKALGESSNQALQGVKRLFNASKMGHTGTLDPLASGLLPLLFGQATKYADDLIEADKEYEATIRLGYRSSTGDSEGEIERVSGSGHRISQQQLDDAVLALTGPILQIPPMHSALKKDGKPLYEYARQGIEIDRPARQVFVRSLRANWSEHVEPGETILWIQVVCSKGTYVRTLAQDLAKRLGTEGYLTRLRRTAIGGLKLADARTYDWLHAQVDQRESLTELLAPVDSLLRSLPRVSLDVEQTKRCLHGQRLPLLGSFSTAGRHRIYGELNHRKNVFLGTGRLETSGKGALLRPERLIQEQI